MPGESPEENPEVVVPKKQLLRQPSKPADDVGRMSRCFFFADFFAANDDGFFWLFFSCIIPKYPKIIELFCLRSIC